jgi:hypothetical protein
VTNDSDHSEVMIPKSTKKSPKKIKYDYSSWKKVLKMEQQKNAKRIDEVEKEYKVLLMKELLEKEKTYQTVMTLRESMTQKVLKPERSKSAMQG